MIHLEVTKNRLSLKELIGCHAIYRVSDTSLGILLKQRTDTHGTLLQFTSEGTMNTIGTARVI